MTTKNKLELFEEKIKLKFKNKELLEQAFVHCSYLNEHPNFHLNHNERLEFLGDAVLELIVTKFLYQNFDNPEGELTSFRSSLVNTKSLSIVAKKLKIDNYLYLSKGEKISEGKAREVILANTLEALIGALYLDQGFQKTEEFIKTNLIPRLKSVLKNKTYKDPKSKLQEITQEKYKIAPKYKLLKESGPDHAKTFTVGVWLKQNFVAKGKGKSKHEAETKAAHAALKKRI